jgi:hypothetical protein
MKVKEQCYQSRETLVDQNDCNKWSANISAIKNIEYTKERRCKPVMLGA